MPKQDGLLKRLPVALEHGVLVDRVLMEGVGRQDLFEQPLGFIPLGPAEEERLEGADLPVADGTVVHGVEVLGIQLQNTLVPLVGFAPVFLCERGSPEVPRDLDGPGFLLERLLERMLGRIVLLLGEQAFALFDQTCDTLPGPHGHGKGQAAQERNGLQDALSHRRDPEWCRSQQAECGTGSG